MWNLQVDRVKLITLHTFLWTIIPAVINYILLIFLFKLALHGDTKKFDVSRMQKQGQHESQKLVDDGCGAVQIWRIESFELEEVEPEDYGQFYAGDCYIVFYTYGNGSKHIIYFWLGQVSAW